MKKQSGGDGMVRVAEDIYEVIRLYCGQHNQNIKEITTEALREWAVSHIKKEDRKIIDQIINKNKI